MVGFAVLTPTYEAFPESCLAFKARHCRLACIE
ncbi:hypothetical protein HDE77_002602 [Rhodanobacter sp. MP7CTX1]|jgi:hypothetical protein|nr:hypothetical protein [Rhodanobacter sp. MP7CTX1]